MTFDDDYGIGDFRSLHLLMRGVAHLWWLQEKQKPSSSSLKHLTLQRGGSQRCYHKTVEEHCLRFHPWLLRNHKIKEQCRPWFLIENWILCEPLSLPMYPCAPALGSGGRSLLNQNIRSPWTSLPIPQWCLECKCTHCTPPVVVRWNCGNGGSTAQCGSCVERNLFLSFHPLFLFHPLQMLRSKWVVSLSHYVEWKSGEVKQHDIFQTSVNFH